MTNLSRNSITSNPDWDIGDIWNYSPPTPEYVNAMSMYLLGTKNHKFLENFLKKTEVASSIDKTLLKTILDLRTNLKNVLANHYLGTTNKNIIYKLVKEKKLIGADIQKVLAYYITGDNTLDELFAKISLPEKDETVTFTTLWGKLRKLLEEQANEITPANINAIDLYTWWTRKIHKRKGRLSTFIESPLKEKDDSIIILNYFIELGKKEEVIEIFPAIKISVEKPSKICDKIIKKVDKELYDRICFSIHHNPNNYGDFESFIRIPYKRR